MKSKEQTCLYNLNRNNRTKHYMPCTCVWSNSVLTAIPIPPHITFTTYQPNCPQCKAYIKYGK